MNLSDSQNAAVKQIKEWLQATSNLRFVLAGYAGTGKTTIARQLAEELGSGVHFLAFTGKAANVLREKGCPNTSTIHSAIYTRVENEQTKKVTWELDYESPIRHAKLVIVDEYSMIPSELRADLEKIARRVLYLGDPFQLPPVKGECDLVHDLMLTEVHRQALDSGIIRVATQVRETLTLGAPNTILNADIMHISRDKADPDIFTQADQILVGFNKTRLGFNARFRQLYEHDKKGKFPQISEKVICLRNNRELGIFNGQIEEMEYASRENKGKPTIEMIFDGQQVEAWRHPFEGEKVPNDFDERDANLFDYAYAITTHKSQGSEWPFVVIYNQPIGRTQEEKARWMYTAITRAQEKCAIIQP